MVSYNLFEYNGYKVYGDDGGQLFLKEVDIVIEQVNVIENELMIIVVDENVLKEKGLIKIIGEDIDKVYIEKLMFIFVYFELFGEVDVNVVFILLYGIVNKLVRCGFEVFGYKNVMVVKEQELLDLNFFIVVFLNLEEYVVFEYVIKFGEEQNVDIFIVIDFDVDCFGIVVKNE